MEQPFIKIYKTKKNKYLYKNINIVINNTNALNTKLGLDINATYIRLDIYLGTGQQLSVGYHVYTNKSDYLVGEKMINNVGTLLNYSI